MTNGNEPKLLSRSQGLAAWIVRRAVMAATLPGCAMLYVQGHYSAAAGLLFFLALGGGFLFHAEKPIARRNRLPISQHGDDWRAYEICCGVAFARNVSPGSKDRNTALLYKSSCLHRPLSAIGFAPDIEMILDDPDYYIEADAGTDEGRKAAMNFIEKTNKAESGHEKFLVAEKLLKSGGLEAILSKSIR